MSIIDSPLEGWQTFKINDGGWQTIPSAIRSVQNDVWHTCDLRL